MVQNLPKINLQDKGDKKDEEQDHLDKLKYLRLKKIRGADGISLREVVNTPVNDRTSQQ